MYLHFATWWCSNKWPKYVVRSNKLNVQKFRCCDCVFWIAWVMNLYYVLWIEFHFVHWNCKNIKKHCTPGSCRKRKVMNKILETITELWCEAQVWPSHNCAACMCRSSKSSNMHYYGNQSLTSTPIPSAVGSVRFSSLIGWTEHIINITKLYKLTCTYWLAEKIQGKMSVFQQLLYRTYI